MFLELAVYTGTEAQCVTFAILVELVLHYNCGHGVTNYYLLVTFTCEETSVQEIESVST